MPHISLAAETLWRLGGFPITNALLTTWLVMGILAVFSFFATRSLRLVPSDIQSIAELLVGGLHDFFQTVSGNYVTKFFPLLATLFLFIVTANWIGLLPGVGTVGFRQVAEAESVSEESPKPVTYEAFEEPIEEAAAAPEAAAHPAEPEFTPLLRGPTADLNLTLALAAVAVVAMQYFGLTMAGVHYLKRFFDFSSPIFFGVGLLELVSDISKIISFAFRLFGNIFAGEVLLAVMAFLMPFIVPLPFLTMELFVGLIQGVVFSMLTAVFMTVAVSHGEHLAHAQHGEH